MTLSIWRYSHLILAVSSFLFIALASVTGTILSVESVQENLHSYKVEGQEKLHLSEVIPAVLDSVAEITELKLSPQSYLIVQGYNEEGEKIHAYIHPQTGAVLAPVKEQSVFYQWVTALHRSLFLKELGRLFVGIISFCLFLIAITGIMLVIKRQHGLRRFFNKITRDSFAQYWHVVLGRWMLIPILIVAFTGAWLSLLRFGVVEVKTEAYVASPAEEEKERKKKNTADFEYFKNISLQDVESIEFPFVADDPEEYYLLKLKDRELILNAVDGALMSETIYPSLKKLNTWSLNMHTGRNSIIWAIIIGIACIKILFFIYSGFTITLQRRRNRIKLTTDPQTAEIIILTGSENGSTLFFANHIHQQLLAMGRKSFIGEMNNLQSYPKAQHLIIFTSTYGLGDAPANASQFLKKLKGFSASHAIKTSVVGFGSRAYPDFCAYAFKVQELLEKQSWAKSMLPVATVNDKSADDFVKWVADWNAHTGATLSTVSATYLATPSRLQEFEVLEIPTQINPDDSFKMVLKPKGKLKFKSGDLLALYPASDHRERFYSIAGSNGKIELIIKYHLGGLASEFLKQQRQGSILKGKIIENAGFHFPKKASSVILISNGTGIAPFLGMIGENKHHTEIHLYAGFRKVTTLTKIYDQFLADAISSRRLTSCKLAYSRDQNRSYVMDLIKADEDKVAGLINKGAVVMICGSLAMQKDVEITLDKITREKYGRPLQFYRDSGQIRSDCY